MAEKHRLVAMGGGTGLPLVLEALKPKQNAEAGFSCDLTAIVTVTDDGGSSGRLRRDLGTLPPGDIRNCLVALSEAPEILQKLFQYRFTQGELEGHSLGNLFIAALAEVAGDFASAVRQMHDILAIRGRIFPSTLDSVHLVAEFTDGTQGQGEEAISRALKSIRRVRLDPPACRALPEACEAIRQAETVLLGPGSLYTSVLPNLLVRDLADALSQSNAHKVYVCNLVTQPGETGGYTVSQHVRALFDHVGPSVCQTVVYNTAPLPPNLAESYRQSQSRPVEADETALTSMGLRAIGADLLARGPHARHDPAKLGEVLRRLTENQLEVA